MVIAYLRVSTGKQHLENQQREINRYAKTRGIVIDNWITETISGTTNCKNRLLGSLIKKLKRGDLLIVTELSRLSRSLHEIMQIMKYCIDNEISVYSTKDGYTFDDSINSKVLSFAFGLTAEIEHKLISQRTREAMAMRKQAGEHMGRRKGSDVKIKYLEANKEDICNRLSKEETIGSICRYYKVSYNTYYRFRVKQSNVDETV